MQVQRGPRSPCTAGEVQVPTLRVARSAAAQSGKLPDFKAASQTDRGYIC